jgi:hypothetical protein
VARIMDVLTFGTILFRNPLAVPTKAQPISAIDTLLANPLGSVVGGRGTFPRSTKTTKGSMTYCSVLHMSIGMNSTSP